MTVRIITADVLDGLAQLEDGSVHCCVCSPPYWGLRNYGVAGQIGLEPTPAEYVAKMVAVFRAVRRVLRNDATLWLNLGDSYATGAGAVGEHPGGGAQGAAWRGSRGGHEGKHGYSEGARGTGAITQPNRMPQAGLKPKDLVMMPARVALALQADGWYLRQDIIWAKPNPMPESVRDRCTKAHEYIFLLAKSERYWFDSAAIAEPAVLPPDAACNRWDRQQSVLAIPPGNNPQKRPARTQRKPAGWDTGDGAHGAIHRDGRAQEVEYTSTDGTTRNKRSVWTVATQPYSEAHFATFQPALIEPCILAGCPVGGTVLDCFGGRRHYRTGCRSPAAQCRAHRIEPRIFRDGARPDSQRCAAVRRPRAGGRMKRQPTRRTGRGKGER